MKDDYSSHDACGGGSTTSIRTIPLLSSPPRIPPRSPSPCLILSVDSPIPCLYRFSFFASLTCPILISHSRPFRLPSSLPHVPLIPLPSPPSRLAASSPLLISHAAPLTHPLPASHPLLAISFRSPPSASVRPSCHGAFISRASFFLACIALIPPILFFPSVPSSPRRFPVLAPPSAAVSFACITHFPIQLLSLALAHKSPPRRPALVLPGSHILPLYSPHLSHPLLVNSDDVEMVPATQIPLSNEVLNSDAADRARERAERMKNGNQHGKEKKNSGRGFDALMASVFIERMAKNSTGALAPIYYCIGCDTSYRNNTKKRNAAHMLGCKELQRDFPQTWARFKGGIDPSAEKIASGEAEAPALRAKKRKLEDPAEGRLPIPGITTALPSGSPSHSQSASSGSTPSQGTLDGAWGESSITASRQSIIDYLLLRLIVCCALAFSLCDNGFFVDFCNAMCPSYSVPNRSSFISYNLVMEAENAMVQLKTLLESFIHLTLSFDGWSSRRSDEIYTVHVSTPTRMSYMVAGIILTGLSTTSETIFENLKAVLLLYAAVRFSMIVSDTTDRDGALRLGLPPRQDFKKETASPLVGYLITNARLMLRAEQKREQRGDSSDGDILVKQIISFMYREAPFDLPCTDLTLRLAWWKSLAKDSNAYVLARLGIKLFSVVPSEMCDERTASKLTAMSTAKRNNLGAENLVRCAQLNQYWRYGFGSSEVQRHCQKVRLELPTPNRKPSDPIVSGIPTLRDLLNADTVDQHPIDEEALFNHPDPYGIKDFEAMEEGEDETDTAPPPLVIRRANIPSLEIETYIDLNTPKLALRFAPDQGKPQPPVPAAAEKPVRAPNAKWSMEDTEWDATAW
ncbi:hypothetical protein DFH09DRAFT_1361827 [Mycena vulgaris]|nr:hypothetical protein DFH09DRAFT_1361827 [Mycena vulgaris]